MDWTKPIDMTTVIINPIEDENNVCPMTMMHFHHATKTAEDFPSDFQQAVDKARKPDLAWNLDDVLKELQGHGWTVLDLPTAEVELNY